jgi:hypothetical protein
MEGQSFQAVEFMEFISILDRNCREIKQFQPVKG